MSSESNLYISKRSGRVIKKKKRLAEPSTSQEETKKKKSTSLSKLKAPSPPSGSLLTSMVSDKGSSSSKVKAPSPPRGSLLTSLESSFPNTSSNVKAISPSRGPSLVMETPTSIGKKTHSRAHNSKSVSSLTSIVPKDHDASQDDELSLQVPTTGDNRGDGGQQVGQIADQNLLLEKAEKTDRAYDGKSQGGSAGSSSGSDESDSNSDSDSEESNGESGSGSSESESESEYSLVPVSPGSSKSGNLSDYSHHGNEEELRPVPEVMLAPPAHVGADAEQRNLQTLALRGPSGLHAAAVNVPAGAMLFQIQQTLREMNHKLTGLEKSSKVTSDDPATNIDPKMFPIPSDELFYDLEAKLGDDKAYKLAMVNYLARGVGMNPADAAYDLVKHCLSREVAMKFVLKSERSKKKKFNKTELYTCILDAIGVKYNRTTEATDVILNPEISLALTRSKDWDNGRNERNKAAPKDPDAKNPNQKSNEDKQKTSRKSKKRSREEKGKKKKKDSSKKSKH